MKSPSQSIFPYVAIRESPTPEFPSGSGKSRCFRIWRSLTAKSSRKDDAYVSMHRRSKPVEFDRFGNRNTCRRIVGTPSPQSTRQVWVAILRSLTAESAIPYANGVPSSSPGLRSANRYPGKTSGNMIQPQRGCVPSVSNRALEEERTETPQALDGFLTGLEYLK